MLQRVKSRIQIDRTKEMELKEREIDREGEIDRQRGKQKEREIDRERERKREKKIGRKREREGKRERDIIAKSLLLS